MKMYPAIRSKMGSWKYYIVRMKMREIANEVQLARDIYEDKTLSDAVQRVLSEQRVKKHIVGYLARNKDRFFSSIVVAAMEGEPSWTPIEPNEEVIPEVFAKMSTLRESFGVLCFGDDPKYYALDGQHRVAAIKLLVNGKVEGPLPENFDEDYMSVIVVLREENENEGNWMRRYRRLFSSLNRYAKPTDPDTNIIMDEDDLFAIVTRQLITEHDFFKAPGPERESFKVQTKNKNLKAGSTHFTSLQTLYAVNETLLTTRNRQNNGWTPDGLNLNKDKQFRPEEDFIENCFTELHHYWDAILATLPDLRKEPHKMRCHDDKDWNGHEHQSHLLFLPIGQILIAPIVREILDNRFEKGFGSVAEMATALAPLGEISWELRDPPWRHLLLVHVPERETWRVRNEERKEALEVAGSLLRWMLELDSLEADDLEALHKKWHHLLYPEQEKETANQMWKKVVATREKIIAL